MADHLQVDYVMDLMIPGLRPAHQNEFPVGIIYSNKASRWYRFRDSSDIFAVISEISRIETLKYLSFQMVKKPISYNYFREVHAKKTRFDLQVNYLLKSIDAKGKRTLIKDMLVQYSGCLLVDYEVYHEMEDGRINFEAATEAR